jgi:energy-coupling factor transporter ATP-binding protein EcfA2
MEQWMMNKNLPPLTDILPIGSEAGMEFERLMKKLLIHDGSLKGYEFEPGVTHYDRGIDGYVRAKYPGADSPVVFQFKWLRGDINSGSNARQIENSIRRFLAGDSKAASYILVTPNDLKDSESKWLKEELPKKYKTDIKFFHYGHEKIQVLLDGYPPLKKHYYGEQVDGCLQDYKSIKRKYMDSISADVKSLQFIGIPTGHYERQNILEKPELAKIYIPLEFLEDRAVSWTQDLKTILAKQNRVVVLGDPGTGKSTLAKYIALIHSQKIESLKDWDLEERVPFIISIREYVRQQRERSGTFTFIDYLKYKSENDFYIPKVENDFFEALLVLGKAIVLFDGLDEIAAESGRHQAAKRIEQFSRHYPDTPVWVTSHIVGYTVNVKLNKETFKHYYLARVSEEQADAFIEKWFEIQLPKNKTQRKDHTVSLQAAVKGNPGVRRLRSNPLLLTMMTLVHQFEGKLPVDRAELYKKCIELLLNKWQAPKDQDLGQKNPLEERGLKYQDQLKLLAAAAHHIQVKNREPGDEETRGLIAEKELRQVFIKARIDKRRGISEESAEEDIQKFLDYIRDRTGLLVEKGRNEKKENVFAFVHLSFLEYLCAYQLAENKSKSRKEHVEALLEYVGISSWAETILLSLYLFSNSTGAESIIDDFCEKMFEVLKREKSETGWYLLGRAVRDNIDFAYDNIKHICREIIGIWLKTQDDKTAFSVLEEIANFSQKGKEFLSEALKEDIEKRPADQAFAALSLLNELSAIDSTTVDTVRRSKEFNELLPYLPALRTYGEMGGLVDSAIEVNNWTVYYNSVQDKSVENLKQVTSSSTHPVEWLGYVIHSWWWAFENFKTRSQFLALNQRDFDSLKSGVFTFRFYDFVSVHFPLNIEFHYMKDTGEKNSPVISSPRLNHEDDINALELTPSYTAQWLDSLRSKGYRVPVEPDEVRWKFQKENTEKMYSFLSRDVSKYSELISGDFSRDFTLNFIRTFILKIGKEFIPGFRKYLYGSFDLDLSQVLDLDLSIELSLNLSRNSSQISSLLVAELYKKRYNKLLDWDAMSANIILKLHELYVDETDSPELKDALSDYFDFEPYGPLEIEFQLSGGVGQSPSGLETNSTSFSSPRITSNVNLPISLEFTFICTSVIFHHIFTLTAALNTHFRSSGEEITKLAIENAVYDYTRLNPLHHYFINFSWEYYSRDFLKAYESDIDGESQSLRLACFVSNAAKVSMTAGIPCEGETWQKILQYAETSSHPAVQISLTLYKICNFMDRETNEPLLWQQLSKFP